MYRCRCRFGATSKDGLIGVGLVIFDDRREFEFFWSCENDERRAYMNECGHGRAGLRAYGSRLSGILDTGLSIRRQANISICGVCHVLIIH